MDGSEEIGLKYALRYQMTPLEIKLWLVMEKPSTPSEIASVTKLKIPTIYAILQKMNYKGSIKLAEDKGVHTGTNIKVFERA